MKRLIALTILAACAPLACVARAQDALSFKGTCSGTQTDINDKSAIQNTPAINCDSVIIMRVEGKTLVSFSNGDPAKPVLMFAGALNKVTGVERPFFTIEGVSWGDGNPMMRIPLTQGTMGPTDMAGRGCYFHFMDQGSFTAGWETRLTMVECELIVDTQNHRPRRATVTFQSELLYTVQGQKFAVEVTNPIQGNPAPNGLNISKFVAKSDQMKIEGLCGSKFFEMYKNDYAGRSVLDGVLRPIEPGSLIEQVFQEVCK
jgi:hypothetical protein